jgi:hypothetical protein
MIGTVILVVIALLVGIALGRVKNSSKLTAIETYLHSAEARIETDASKVIAIVKAKL